MDVGLVTYSTRPRGSVVHTLALAEALARRGARVTVHALSRGGGLFRPVDPRVRVRLTEAPACEDVEERVLASIATLAAAVAPFAHDVVHAQDCIAANAVPGCLRTVHHVDHFTSPALVACHDRAIAEPAALVCPSPAVAAELRDGWGREATIIPNGVDARRFAAAAGDDPPAAAARRWWRDRLGPGPVVLSVGGIEPRKGTIDLLEAVARLRRRREVRLVVAGGETLWDYRPYRAAFDARAAALGVEVEVLGSVAHERLPALVACADVFALASLTEGFGLAAMEALAARVPVVLRDGPVVGPLFAGAARVGTDPGSLADALEAALDDPAPADRAARGAALAAGHSLDALARAHLRLYRAVAPTVGAERLAAARA